MSGQALGGALLVIGDVVTDIVALHANALAPDTDTAARIAFRPGGSGANTAAWAASSGTEVRLLARVGANSADWHRDELRVAGVGAHLVVDREAATAVVISLVDAAAERTLVTDSGAAVRLGRCDWDAALLDGAAHVHLSGYLYFTERGRQLAATVHAAAREAGIPVSVDPASTGFIERLGLLVFLAAVDGVGLILPNLAEARLLAGTPDQVAAAERLSARHGEAVVTLGAAGALAAREGTLLARVPGVAARAVDSTGAGDAFTGGFLAARLAGADLVEATEAGCRTGAAAVEVLGGRPPLPC
ncbi:PfkB family carbohydrate kinase [Kitasatospora cystarginea]|uniref:PfkB family carbohydrate kinase n=1 Tax=Kitasatospora cystarginea TaxID=58350 RepID=A0ABN3DFQ8_9ACTN